MKLYSLGFNGRSNPQRISVGIDYDGLTRIYFPGTVEACVVRKSSPVEINISGDSPGPDVAILVEAFREWIDPYDSDGGPGT
jgi:hypothetical protein